MIALPPQPPPQLLHLPRAAERTLANGLRAIAVERKGIPRAEVRATVPIANRGGPGDHAAAALLGRTLLSGTARRSGAAMARELRHLGAELSASSDLEQLRLSGGMLSRNLAGFLAVLADALTAPSFAATDVAAERDRVLGELDVARRRPQIAGTQVLIRRLYGDHPYSHVLPDSVELSDVQPGALRRLHATAARPDGAAVVVVSSGKTGASLDAVEAALGGWVGAPGAAGLSAPEVARPAGATIIDRPGVPQTVVLMAAPVPPLGHPDDPAVQLAVALLGGHSSARLTANLRSRHGFAYYVECSIQRRRLASQALIATAISTPVTGPALVELQYELGRLATSSAESAELEMAKRQLCGKLSLSIQTRAGLANQVAGLAVAGQPVEYLVEMAAAIVAVTAEQAAEAAGRYLSPRSFETVLVGDASSVASVAGGLYELNIPGDA